MNMSSESTTPKEHDRRSIKMKKSPAALNVWTGLDNSVVLPSKETANSLVMSVKSWYKDGPRLQKPVQGWISIALSNRAMGAYDATILAKTNTSL